MDDLVSESSGTQESSLGEERATAKTEAHAAFSQQSLALVVRNLKCLILAVLFQLPYLVIFSELCYSDIYESSPG